MSPSSEPKRLWRIALALNQAADAGALPPLLFFTDPARTPRPWQTAARLPAGAAVVYRHFGAGDALATAQRLRAATRGAGVRLLIGLDAELARAVEADGVHLPQRAVARAPDLKAARPDWIVTGAAHGPIDGAGLDAAVVSPVFQAGGASATRPALGPAGFKALVERLAVPAYALGGLNDENAETLMGSGACGLAGVEGVVAAFGP